MSYTWTTGEVITAEKLNNTGGGESGEYTITPTGGGGDEQLCITFLQ